MSVFPKASIWPNETSKISLNDLHPYEYSLDLISRMELRWPLALQEGNKVVKHVYVKVLTINPPE